ATCRACASWCAACDADKSRSHALRHLDSVCPVPRRCKRCAPSRLPGSDRRNELRFRNGLAAIILVRDTTHIVMPKPQSSALSPHKLRIATRQSALALWQAEHVAARLRAAHRGLEVELVPMTTRGDQISDRPLAAI